jgi:hypothetical protein
MSKPQTTLFTKTGSCLCLCEVGDHPLHMTFLIVVVLGVQTGRPRTEDPVERGATGDAVAKNKVRR